MNEKEFARLIESTKKVVLAAAARNLYPRYYHALDDVVQETYLRAYRALTRGGLRADSSLVSWLYTIAKNESIRMNKKCGRGSHESISEYEWLPGDEGSAAHELLEVAELYEKIGRLPEKYRDVMELVSRGHSEKEIADVLSIPGGTVKSRASRGREMLQKLYMEAGYES